jgi:hypothetical protein
MRSPYRSKIKGCSHVVLVLFDLLPEAHRLVILQRIDVLNNITSCTDKIENQILLIYKEIQSEAVAKSYVRKGLTASSNMTKYLRISSYIRKPILIYDFATAQLWISLNMRKI